VAVRVSWFAGRRAAVSDAVAEMHLSVVGMGAGPDGPSLARLQDGTAYHFALKQPLRPGSEARIQPGGRNNPGIGVIPVIPISE
jgi:hypothetical protein